MGWYKTWLTPAASLTAVPVGIFCTLGGYTYTAMLLIFFVSGSLATKISAKIKRSRLGSSGSGSGSEAHDCDAKKGRAPMQVLATGGVPALLCAMAPHLDADVVSAHLLPSRSKRVAPSSSRDSIVTYACTLRRPLVHTPSPTPPVHTALPGSSLNLCACNWDPSAPLAHAAPPTPLVSLQTHTRAHTPWLAVPCCAGIFRMLLRRYLGFRIWPVFKAAAGPDNVVQSGR